MELTDQFTKKAYPELNKLQRKTWEDARLTHISRDAQTVKYPDILFNAKWMMLNDIEHASAYLRCKMELLTIMDKGDGELRRQVLQILGEMLS